MTEAAQSTAALQTFINSIIALAEIESFCRTSDSRLNIIPFERKQGGLALFVLNGTRRLVTADIIFPSEVQIADLGLSLSEKDEGLGLPDPNTPFEERQETPLAVANRFSLEVPPFGIISFMIEGSSYTEMKERQLAALLAEKTRENATSAANTELPGFASSEGIEDLWN
jgi:hypothetical protein